VTIRVRFRRSAAAGAVLAAVLLLPGHPLAAQEVPTFELDTLLVSGASRLPGGAVGRVVTLVEREELLAQPVTSVSEAVRWALGSDLQVRSPAQADLSLRGASYEGVLVLVDGVRMSDAQTGHFDLDLTVPLERVERIEILLGPASAQFGTDAVGGVVNIVTRSDWSGAEVRSEAGSFGRWAVAAAGGAVTEGWDVGGAFERTASDGHRAGTDYDALLLDGHAARTLGSGTLGLSGGYGRRDFGAADFYGPYPAYERTRTTMGALRWDGRVGGVELVPRVHARRHSDDFILIRTDPSVYRNRHVSKQWGADVVTRVPLGGGRSAAIGGEWLRETLDSNALGQREQDRLGAFGELTTPLGGGRMGLGVRVDRREGFETFVSPSLSLGIPLTAALRLRAQAGRAFRTPTWTERYYEDPANLGTPDLRGERSWSAEVGADASLPGGALLRATAFRRHSDDLIDWARPVDDPDGRWRTRNVQSATFDGLELTGQAGTLSTVRLSVQASWLDVETEDAEGFGSKSTLRPLVRTLGLALEREIPGGGVARVGLRDQTRAGEAGVLLLDARLGLGLPFGELFLAGTNLADEGYPDLSGLPAQGRALSIGLRARAGG